eukprot:3522798-Rhodomonas_salina.1
MSPLAVEVASFVSAQIVEVGSTAVSKEVIVESSISPDVECAATATVEDGDVVTQELADAKATGVTRPVTGRLVDIASLEPVDPAVTIPLMPAVTVIPVVWPAGIDPIGPTVTIPLTPVVTVTPVVWSAGVEPIGSAVTIQLTSA